VVLRNSHIKSLAPVPQYLLPGLRVVIGVAPAHLHRAHQGVLAEHVGPEPPVHVLALLQGEPGQAEHEGQNRTLVGGVGLGEGGYLYILYIYRCNPVLFIPIESLPPPPPPKRQSGHTCAHSTDVVKQLMDGSPRLRLQQLQHLQGHHPPGEEGAEGHHHQQPPGRSAS